MEYSREAIKDAIEWDGGGEDGNGPDWAHDVLEKADPKLVAAVRRDLRTEWRDKDSRLDFGTSFEDRLPKPCRKETEAEIEAKERRYRLYLPFHFIQD